MKKLIALLIGLTFCLSLFAGFGRSYAYGQGIVAFKKETVSSAYGMEIYSIIYSAVNLKSIPMYDDSGREVGRKLWIIDEKHNPKTLVMVYSNYQWDKGRLTRKSEDKIAQVTYVEVLDTEGRTVRELKDVGGGRRISISYNWEGGTNRCNSAKATFSGLILGEAKVVDIGGNEREGYYQIVEETHFAPDKNIKVIYRARSRYAISYMAAKVEEKPVWGKKVYELFSHWGRVE